MTKSKSSNSILIAFALNAGFSVVEFIGGYYTNSVAITSDALHDLGDSLALLFSYFAEKFSLKKTDEKFTHGYRRFSLLAALVNGMIGLALLGILVNTVAALKLREDAGLNSKMISASS
jgi:cobalt-zinc-cadmium efflux system protein